jgi:metal-responsive CopG/Arc/MetJ family transcriptional regulator
MEMVMSRILVDLTDTQLSDITQIADADKRARAAVIRDALDSYIAQRKPAFAGDVFGLWENRQTDGLEYQEKLRSEW